MARARIVPVSFKKTEEAVYQEILKHSDHSAFIKGCILFWMANSNSNFSTGQNTPINENKGSTYCEVEPLGISNDILGF